MWLIYIIHILRFWQRIHEGPIRRTREGGSEWEPIKILLEGDGNSNKMNTASNTRLRLTTQVGQAHIATGPRNQHTTFRPENAAEHQTSSPLTNTGQTGEHHLSDPSLLVKLGDFH
jgi:Tfp pilus assembly protein FimT